MKHSTKSKKKLSLKEKAIKPKTVSYYERILSQFSPRKLEKFRKFVDIVGDEIEMGAEPGEPLPIDIKQFQEAGLLVEETMQIHFKFCCPEFSLFSPSIEDFYSNAIIFPAKPKLKEIILPSGKKAQFLQIILFPYDDTRNKNLWNLKKALENIVSSETKTKILQQEKISKEHREDKPRLLITRDKKTGDFYFKNKLINFSNKNTIYYLLFECLCEKSDTKGFCSIETINKYLERHDKEKLIDDRKMKDRIKNGVIDLFRFSDLHNETPDGKLLIKKERGKGLIFYNPQI